MWTPISEISAGSPDRFGFKALRLADAQARGLRIPESHVLECETLAGMREDPSLAEAAATEICHLISSGERILLRSSSPLEDRPESSAAGLLPTISRAIRVDALAEGLREMARAMEKAPLRTLLGTGEDAVPLAVLAQPRLELELWCTLEWDPERGSARIEGRQLDSCGDHPFEHDAVPLAASDTLSESGIGLGALMELARHAQEESEGVWLLELGIADGEAVLLQRRPVSVASPHAGAKTEWFEFPVFEDDRARDWIWDAAHSPRPLAPLLASIFVEWIRERGEEHPSRIIDGRWHDRRERDEVKDAAEPIAGPAIELPAPEKADPGDALREALRKWYEERIPTLERSLELVEMLAGDCREYASWRLFVVAWLDWQSKYYDGSAGRLRRLAAGFLPEDAPPPPMPPTLSRSRERALDELAAQWEDWDDTLRAEYLGEFLDEHGHHGPGAWDGYGVPWDQDPSPLLRELERRVSVLATDGARSAKPGKASGEADGAEGFDGTEDLTGEETRVLLPDPDADDTAWAVYALAALEDDDDLLAYSYALFRDAALNLEEELQPEAGDGEILDILESDLEGLEAAPSQEAWQAARARGARVRARWDQALPADSPPASEGELLHAHHSLCEGQAEGRARVLDSAMEGGGPEAGEILVVPTILPGDALVFGRCAGLICESGEVLGHAAVLAREYGLPALVLPQACSRLRECGELHLDASAGVVRVRSRKEAE